MPGILLIDDNDEFVKALSEILWLNGYATMDFASPAHALAYLEIAPALPDAIILDMIPPRLEGRRFLERLAQHFRWSEIPILLTSTLPFRLYEATLPEGITYRALRKPFSVHELLQWLEQTAGTPTPDVVTLAPNHVRREMA